MAGYLVILTSIAALGCALNAGVLFAFSAFVMPALARLAPAQGIAAMQAINVAAVTPAFMSALFGTAILCAALGVVALTTLDEPYAVYLLVGSALYLVGTIGLTIVYHVPRNNALARVEPSSAEAAGTWTTYMRDWTRWNHVRAAAGLAAGAAFAAALSVG